MNILKNAKRGVYYSSEWTTDNVYGNDLRFGSVALNTKDLTERKMRDVMGPADKSIKLKWNENISSRLVELLLNVCLIKCDASSYYSLPPQLDSEKCASWKAQFNL
jgi:hypothetical protein